MKGRSAADMMIKRNCMPVVVSFSLTPWVDLHHCCRVEDRTYEEVA